MGAENAAYASALWTAEEAAEATGGALLGPRDWTAQGVSIDSRSLAPRELFVALSGLHRDGHQFVKDALARGAAACLVSGDVEGVGDAASLLQVGDTLTALNDLARAAVARTSARRIAVTGSVGKTSTKEMLRHVLAAQGRTHASVASYNNLWGVPLSLARMPADTDYGVFEIGMNHAGEITPLSRLVAPEVAVITAIAPVHLEFFADVTAIADAKAEVFEGLVAGGWAVLNADDAHYERLAAAARAQGADIMTFGTAASAKCRALEIETAGTGSRVRADIDGQIVTYTLSVAGRHWVSNSLAVLACVRILGADIAAAARSLHGVTALKGRGAVTEVVLPQGGFTLIDESYNANPASMAAALATLGARPVPSGGRRVAVLGDMLELGAEAASLHAALASDIEEAGIDQVFLCGPLMKALWERLAPARRGGYGACSQDLVAPLRAAVRAGDVVMVKGSLGSRMAPIVDGLIELSAQSLSSQNTHEASAR